MEPRAHIFACNKAAVHGDLEVIVGIDMKIQKVEDVENEFHFVTRKYMGRRFFLLREIDTIMRDKIEAH